MKATPNKATAKAKVKAEEAPRLRMTRELAEARAVGDPSKPKFDGVALLRSLKR
jgi:hypothetical protein